MHLNFSGVWNLVHAEAEFRFLPAPELRVDTITHDEPQININTRQIDANGDITVDRSLTIGGDPTMVMILNRPRIIRAFWDSESLVIETRTEVSNKPRRIEDRWTLDENSDWLTIMRLHELPGGPVRQKLRLQRL